MSTTSMRRMVPGVALAVALTLSACSSSPEENNAAACSALQEYQSSLDAFAKALTPDATVDQLKTANESVKAAADKLDEAVGSVETDRVSTLDDAWKSMSDTVDDLSGDASVTSAIESIKVEVEKVQRARLDLGSAIRCS